MLTPAEGESVTVRRIAYDLGPIHVKPEQLGTSFQRGRLRGAAVGFRWIAGNAFGE
ncbi:MAG: hypothetical protein R3A78_02910 [Polyangiales bacterium]